MERNIYALIVAPANLSALLTSFSSFNVLFRPTSDKTSSDFFAFLDGSTSSTTPNRSCLFFTFSSISAFFITLEDDVPNLSARFFKVSISADGAPPILVPVPNLSALDCFLVSEVRSFSLDTTASVRFDKFWVPSNLAARFAARSSSVHFLMVNSMDFSAFFLWFLVFNFCIINRCFNFSWSGRSGFRNGIVSFDGNFFSCSYFGI